MARPPADKTAALSRRASLATTGATLVGATAAGLARQADAANRHPQRLALYREIDSIVNDELPILYLHHLTCYPRRVDYRVPMR